MAGNFRFLLESFTPISTCTLEELDGCTCSAVMEDASVAIPLQLVREALVPAFSSPKGAVDIVISSVSPVPLKVVFKTGSTGEVIGSAEIARSNWPPIAGVSTTLSVFREDRQVVGKVVIVVEKLPPAIPPLPGNRNR